VVNFLSQYLLVMQIINTYIWLSRDHITMSLNQYHDFIEPPIIVIIGKSHIITFRTTSVNISANPVIDNGVLTTNQTKILIR